MMKDAKQLCTCAAWFVFTLLIAIALKFTLQIIKFIKMFICTERERERERERETLFIVSFLAVDESQVRGHVLVTLID